MGNIKNAAVVFCLFISAGCGVSKMKYPYPLTTDNEKKIYDVCSDSRTFGQLDVKIQTDTPYYLYLQSGFYERNHFSLSLSARESKKGDAFYVSMRASKGEKMVKNSTKEQRKQFLLELKSALGGTTE